MTDLTIGRSAVFSADRKMRLRLDRDLGLDGAVAAVIGVNPSIAGGSSDDPSITKVMGFAARLRWSRFIMLNKFAHIATNVHELAAIEDPTGGKENDDHLARAMSEADIVVVAWGPLNKLPTRLRGRWRNVVAIAQGKPLHCWGTALDGHPRHPLMLAYATPLIRWEQPL